MLNYIDAPILYVYIAFRFVVVVMEAFYDTAEGDPIRCENDMMT